MRRLAAVLLAALALAACTGDAPPAARPTGGEGEAGGEGAAAESASAGATTGEATTGPTVSREAFIETYVALRYQAVQSPANELPPRERDRILEEHGVTEDELLAFVEAHGDDPTYMESVWSEVESRMDALQEPGRVRPDSAG